MIFPLHSHFLLLTTMNNEQFMTLALKEASTSQNDLPIGAVLVCDDRVIAAASNQKERTSNPLNHAEKIVIEEGLKKLGDFRGKNIKLYVTLEPCPMCAAAIILSRINEVYFGAYDLLYGAFGSKINMSRIMNSKIKIQGGILENECSKILTNYFKQLREEEYGKPERTS